MQITNVAGSPVQIDDEGRQLEAFDTADLDPAVPWVARALAQGRFAAITDQPVGEPDAPTTTKKRGH